MPWSAKPCRSTHCPINQLVWNIQVCYTFSGFLVFSWIILMFSSSFVTSMNPLLSDACIVSWGEQCKMADLPISRMDVRGVPGLWLFERVPSPTSGLGIPGALKKPVKTQDIILRTNTDTQPTSPKMGSQRIPRKVILSTSSNSRMSGWGERGYGSKRSNCLS